MKQLQILILLGLSILVIGGCQSKSTAATNTAKKVSNAVVTNLEAPQSPPKPDIIEPTKLSTAESKKLLSEQQKLFRPWIDGAKTVALLTNDENAKIFVDIMENSVYAIPFNDPDPELVGVEQLSSAKDPTKPSVRVTVLRKNFVPSNRHWKEINDGLNQRVAFYEPLMQCIIIKESEPINPIIGGLVMHHEMQHAFADAMLKQGQKNAPQGVLGEVDAYGYEFFLLDKLKRPNYVEFMNQELPKIASSPAYQVDQNDPRLVAIFGPLNNETSKQLAAGIMSLRVAFAHAESMPQHLAMQRKVEILQQQNY